MKSLFYRPSSIFSFPIHHFRVPCTRKQAQTQASTRKISISRRSPDENSRSQHHRRSLTLRLRRRRANKNFRQAKLPQARSHRHHRSRRQARPHIAIGQSCLHLDDSHRNGRRKIEGRHLLRLLRNHRHSPHKQRHLRRRNGQRRQVLRHLP